MIVPGADHDCLSVLFGYEGDLFETLIVFSARGGGVLDLRLVPAADGDVAVKGVDVHARRAAADVERLLLLRRRSPVARALADTCSCSRTNAYANGRLDFP